VLALLLVLLAPVSSLQAGELTLTFFDVGQGDAALIVSPTGKRVLVDGGPPEGSEALLAALRQRNIDRLDLVLLSHPHLDHFGGLTKLVKQVPVALFMDAGYPTTSPPYTTLLKQLAAAAVPVKQAQLGRSIDLGDGATLLVLGPPTPWIVGSRSDVNANSVIARLSWRGRTALFSGDAEPDAEKWLLAQYSSEATLLRAEVLKVPHHGGRYSSTAAFLGAVQPQWAVISVAAVNDYHHPTPEAMARIEKVGARLLRTDQLGSITLRSRDGQPWEQSSDRPRPTQDIRP
jgi:beta-lactamase superfamily II metal-dependent hydrolase